MSNAERGGRGEGGREGGREGSTFAAVSVWPMATYVAKVRTEITTGVVAQK